MALKAKVELYDSVEFMDGRRLFIGSDDDEIMRFQSPRSKSLLLLPQDKFLKLLSRGDIRVLRDSPQRTPKKKLDSRVVVNPDTSPEKLRKGKVLLFYVMCHDRSIEVPTGLKGLARFISNTRVDAFKRGYQDPVSPRQLQRGLSKGEVGKRNLAAMISQQGEGPRDVTPIEIKRAYEATARFYYAQLETTKQQAFDFLKNELQDLIDRGYIYKGKLLELPKRMTTLIKYIYSAEVRENTDRKNGKYESSLLYDGSASVLHADAPFDSVIIDHTVCDVMAVDDKTGLPLGRPIIAVALDVFSRCPVGFFISFESPSISTLLSLIKMVATDKEHLSVLLPEGETHSLSFGKMNLIYIDRGLENLSDALADTCAELGIDVDFCPRRNGRAKSPGERFFESLNDALFHVLPGAVAHGPTDMRRLQLNPAVSATMSLSQITAATYTALVQYEQRWHRGIKAIPCEKLNDGYIKNGQPLFDDIRVLESHIGDTKEVRLWHYGIDFKGERFVNPNGTTEIRSAELGRQKAIGKIKPSTRQQAVKVKIKFNPADCSVIHVHFKRGKHWDYVAFQNDEDEFCQGLSFKMSREIRVFAREQGYAFENEPQRIRARARYLQHIQSLFKLKKITRAQKKAMAKLNAMQEAADDPNEDDRKSTSTAELVPFSKAMGTPSTDRQDSATRKPGIRRGAAKADATRRRNKKIKAEDKKQHEAFADAPQAMDITQDEEERLDFTFTSLGKAG